MIDPKLIARRWFRREDFRSDFLASLRMVGAEPPPLDAYDGTLRFTAVTAEVSLRRIYRPILGAVREALERLGRAVAS